MHIQGVSLALAAIAGISVNAAPARQRAPAAVHLREVVPGTTTTAWTETAVPPFATPVALAEREMAQFAGLNRRQLPVGTALPPLIAETAVVPAATATATAVLRRRDPAVLNIRRRQVTVDPIPPPVPVLPLPPVLTLEPIATTTAAPTATATAGISQEVPGIVPADRRRVRRQEPSVPDIPAIIETFINGYLPAATATATATATAAPAPLGIDQRRYRRQEIPGAPLDARQDVPDLVQSFFDDLLPTPTTTAAATATATAAPVNGLRVRRQVLPVSLPPAIESLIPTEILAATTTAVAAPTPALRVRAPAMLNNDRRQLSLPAVPIPFPNFTVAASATATTAAATVLPATIEAGGF